MVAPVWFIVHGVHDVPMLWQFAHVFAVIGAVVWLVGRPACGAARPAVLWHPDWVQSVAAVTLLWLKLAGVQAVVAWQDEHCVAVLICPTLEGVQLLPE